MTIPVARQPNIGDGLDDQTNIYLTLFNTILETTHHELNFINLGKLFLKILELENSGRPNKGWLEINLLIKNFSYVLWFSFFSKNERFVSRN
jgi:hypothetical protein